MEVKPLRREPEGIIRHAIFKKAIGYWAVETKETVETDAQGATKRKSETVRKRMPPDLSAIHAWYELNAPEGPRGGGIELIHSIPRAEGDGDGAGEDGEDGDAAESEAGNGEKALTKM